MSEAKRGRAAKPETADTTEPKQYHMASCSFGKDSLAMILMLIEKSYPLDEAVFFDTGMEFKAIYDTRDKMLPIFKAHGIKYTELSPKMPFEYKMFEKPVCKRGTNIVYKKGYGWCGGTCRWGTTEKLQALNEHRISKNSKCYIGIANDETERLEKEKPNWKLYPLADWEMTEKDCLQLCYNNGFEWKECGIRL